MKKTINRILILMVTMIPLLVFSQANNRVSLSNYKIALNTKGAVIGKVVSPLGNVKIERDTAKIFTISKNGEIKLKPNISLQANIGSHSYGLTLKINKQIYNVELVKDEFLINKVIAHRGAWKNTQVMQNSIRSFEHAVVLGCEGSEFDVWLSKDNKVVLSHDPIIGGLKVEDSTAEELRTSTMETGDHVPTLEEFLKIAMAQNKTRMVLEIKHSQKGMDRTLALTDSVISIVHGMKAQGYIEYISFSYEALLRIMELDPTACTSYLTGDKSVNEIKAHGLTGIDYDFYVYRNNPTIVEDCEKLGLTTNVWTVNEEKELELYLRKGVDYITTDEPELLLKLINRKSINQ